MEGCVNLGYSAMHRPGVELATSRSQVRRRTTTLPLLAGDATRGSVMGTRPFNLLNFYSANCDDRQLVTR